jgi:hypothetical protein
LVKEVNELKIIKDFDQFVHLIKDNSITLNTGEKLDFYLNEKKKDIDISNDNNIKHNES